MQFGTAYFPTHDAMGPAAIARLVEDHGQESLFVAEHTHTPAARDSAYPGGGELPRKYNHTYDPFVALTAAATVTTRLRIGTGVCLINQRDPITTAKAEVLERCETLGLTRATHWLPSNGRGPVQAQLERWEAAIAELLGTG